MVNSIILNKKSQFSIIEVSILVLLFVFVSSYVYFDFKTSSSDYNLNVDSALDSIYYSEDFRVKIINENLNSVGNTENWNSLESNLDKMYLNYEFVISDKTHTKKIFSCSATNGKIYSERIISIDSGSNFKFRKIKLGVCY